MLRVKQNTFLGYPGVVCRANDTSEFPKVLWSITWPNQREDFKSGPIGVIAQNKSKGWVLELEEIREVENGTI